MGEKLWDVIILGGGPAGASAALYTARAGKSTLILARDEGALAKAERIDNFYGAAAGTSGPDLFREGLARARTAGAEVKKDEIFSFSREEEILVKGAAGEYRARALILAPGAKRLRPAGLNVQDYEGAGVSYCVVCDGFFFQGKRVALLGDGEYARHELAELANFTEDVTVLTNGGAGEFPGAKVRREPVEALYGDGRFEGVVLAGEKVPFDGLFIALGVAGAADFARKAGLFVEGDRIVTDAEKKTELPGVFAAGDCTERIKQVAVAAGSGAQAALSALQYLRKG